MTYIDFNMIYATEAREVADARKKLNDIAEKNKKFVHEQIIEVAKHGFHEIELVPEKTGVYMDDKYIVGEILDDMKTWGYEAHEYYGRIYISWERAPTKQYFEALRAAEENATKADNDISDAKQEQDETPECAESEKPTDI